MFYTCTNLYFLFLQAENVLVDGQSTRAMGVSVIILTSLWLIYTDINRLLNHSYCKHMVALYLWYSEEIEFVCLFVVVFFWL